MSKLDTKIREALFDYLKTTTYRDLYYFILVYEHGVFNCHNLYMIELEDSPEKSPSDLSITYMMDYDEGQDITVLKVHPKHEVYNILKNLYYNNLQRGCLDYDQRRP